MVSLDSATNTNRHALRDLIRAAQAGDVGAIEGLVARFSGLIHKECGKYGVWQNPEWSHSDQLQEVIFRVWTKIEQFNGTEHEHVAPMFEQWVRVTCQSVLKNLYRARSAKKRKPEGKIEAFDEVTQDFVNRKGDKTPSSIFSANEDIERLNVAMEEQLDDQGREILNLRVVEGLSLKEISERLSLTYEQVRYRYHASLEKLGKQLGSDGSG